MKGGPIAELGKTLRLGRYVLDSIGGIRHLRPGSQPEAGEARLRALVKYAYEHVDLYRAKYDRAGVKPDDIRATLDLGRLPIITKQDFIDAYPQAMLARGFGRRSCRIIATSGSTGVPVRVYKDEVLLRRACLGMLLMRWMVRKSIGVSVKPGMLAIVVTSPDSLEAVMADEMAALPGFLTKSYQRIDAREDAREHLKWLTLLQPDIVITYPSVLRNLAILARENNLPVPQPKVLVVSAELLDENTRRLISSVFQGRILNLYASTEGGIIALECGCGEGLHIRSSSVIVELLRDGKPVPRGQPGDVVITNLLNKSTPIIRYSGLGDVAAYSERACSCGDASPLLRVIEGRIADSLVLPDGRRLHPFSLTLALEHVPALARFQIIQESGERVRALVVAVKDYHIDQEHGDGHLEAEIRGNLRSILGEGIEILVDRVPDIPESRQPGYHTVKSLIGRQN